MTDRKPITPADVHRQMSRWAATLAERCVVPTEAEPQYVEPSGFMVSEHTRRLVAEFDRYTYRPTPITRDPQWDALGGMLPWATVVPVPPPAELPRGLYADDPTEPAAECGKEGPMEWTVEKLTEVVEESEWWAKFKPVQVGFVGESDSDPSAFIREGGGAWCDRYEPHRPALRALLSDIRTGAIFGSGERCAVCGKGGAEERLWHDTTARTLALYVHRGCEPDTIDPASAALPLVAAILRARRLLGERKEKAAEPVPPAKPEMTQRERWLGSPASCAICGHGPAAPTFPFDSFICWGETGVRPTSPVDMQVCELAWMDGCKSEHSDDRRENERRIVERAHAWYVANADRERPYAAQAARESSDEFAKWDRLESSNSRWRVSEEVLAGRSADRADAERKERRRRVLLGLEKGNEPSVGLMLCPDNVFDPRGR